MGSVLPEVLIIVVLIIANGIFSLAEVAVVTSRKTRLKQRAHEGDAKAQAALELAETPNRFLSTIQVGITLIGVMTGAFGGATISHQIAASLHAIPRLAPYAESIGLGVVVLVITYFTLILGELVPKRIALHSPERIASAVAMPMRWLARLAHPIVTVLSFSTDSVLRVLGLKPSEEPPITEQEIKMMMEQGTKVGIFDPIEHIMVKRVFRLGDRTVGSLMTLRQDIVWIDLDDPMDENMEKLSSTVYSRVLACRGDLDNVVGILRAKDLLNQCLQDHPVDLTANLLAPVFVPDTLPAMKLLETLKKERTHIVLVVDEYGTIQGLITLNDILESIVGDLPAVDESDEPDRVQRDDGSWLMDGALPIDELKEIFKLETLPGEENGGFLTLSGFIMKTMGRVPATGECFEVPGLHFEIMDMDGHRIDKVLVSSVQEEDTEGASEQQLEA